MEPKPKHVDTTHVDVIPQSAQDLPQRVTIIPRKIDGRGYSENLAFCVPTSWNQDQIKRLLAAKRLNVNSWQERFEDSQPPDLPIAA